VLAAGLLVITGVIYGLNDGGTLVKKKWLRATVSSAYDFKPGELVIGDLDTTFKSVSFKKLNEGAKLLALSSCGTAEYLRQFADAHKQAGICGNVYQKYSALDNQRIEAEKAISTLSLLADAGSESLDEMNEVKKIDELEGGFALIGEPVIQYLGGANVLMRCLRERGETRGGTPSLGGNWAPQHTSIKKWGLLANTAKRIEELKWAWLEAVEAQEDQASDLPAKLAKLRNLATELEPKVIALTNKSAYKTNSQGRVVRNIKKADVTIIRHPSGDRGGFLGVLKTYGYGFSHNGKTLYDAVQLSPESLLDRLRQSTQNKVEEIKKAIRDFKSILSNSVKDMRDLENQNPRCFGQPQPPASQPPASQQPSS